jgi:Putative DnaT-like ssDNA binding protein
MMVTIVTTPAAADANSYAAMSEANSYFEQRLPLPTEWVSSGELEARALLTAARYLDVIASPLTVYVPAQNGVPAHYLTRPSWTGQPTTTTQRLSWPRIGMFDRNGNAIDSMAIPIDLKLAQCEFAGQLKLQDRTLDNDVITQGIRAVRAGSVSVDFKDLILPAVWPQAVSNMLVPSWLSDVAITYQQAVTALFESVSVHQADTSRRVVVP